MSNRLLAGKRGIIFGALDEKSIAWQVAEKCAAQGATFTLTNAPVALRFGGIYDYDGTQKSMTLLESKSSL